MAESEPVYIASIGELIDTFRDAMLALIPSAERAQLTWKDINTHDDWEALTGCLYRVFVANLTTLDSTAPVEPKPLAPYDYDLEDYSKYSWIEFDLPGSTEKFALVRLLTSEQPFDTLQLVRIDPASGIPGHDIKVPWSDTGFLLRRQFVDGTSAVIQEVRIDW